MNRKIYNETLQACLAGGMTDDAAHEYATDKATRNEALKVQHTPGPWVACPRYTNRQAVPIGKATENGQGYPATSIFAETFGHNCDANAVLIAQAPVMFEALREIAERGPVDGYSSASALRLRLVASQTIARKALAKAAPDNHPANCICFACLNSATLPTV